MNQQLGPNQTQWLEALRSNNYAQGSFSLRRDDTFCCLGVGCDIFEVPSAPPTHPHGSTFYGRIPECAGAPLELIEILQLYGSVGMDINNDNSLAQLNDNGASFPEIAARITADPAMYFRSPECPTPSTSPSSSKSTTGSKRHTPTTPST